MAPWISVRSHVAAALVAAAGLFAIALPCDAQDAGDYQACLQKDANACWRLGKWNYLPSDPRDFEKPADPDKAVHFYRKACEIDVHHCSLIGDMYADGEGFAVDYAKAAAEYSRACDGGDPVGCERFGHLLERGEGVAADPARAPPAYERACAKDGLACDHLGAMLQDGRGVARDPARAVSLLRKGCDANDSQACVRLGVAYRDGLGVARDPEAARKLFTDRCRASGGFFACREACEAGDGNACVAAAHRYDTGDGVAFDNAVANDLYERAARLFDAACDRGDPAGCESFWRLARNVQPIRFTDRALAQRFFTRACEREPNACDEAGRPEGGSGAARRQRPAGGLPFFYATETEVVTAADSVRLLGGQFVHDDFWAHARTTYAWNEARRGYVDADGAMLVRFGHLKAEIYVGQEQCLKNCLPEGLAEIQGLTGAAAAEAEEAAKKFRLVTHVRVSPPRVLVQMAGCLGLRDEGRRAASRLGLTYEESALAVRLSGTRATILGFLLIGAECGDQSTTDTRLLPEVLSPGGPELAALAAAPDPANLVPVVAQTCAGGDRDACYRLAQVLVRGIGVPRDPARAAGLFEKVCATDPRACVDLARQLEQGDGVPRDPRRAADLVAAACAAGDAYACERRTP